MGALRKGRRLPIAGAAVATACCAVLAGASAAQAAGEYELNDSFNTAYGPIMSGTTYTAGFETQNDIDLYYFYLPSLTQLQYQLSVPADVDDDVVLTIYRAQLEGGTSWQTDLAVYGGHTGSNAISLERGKYFVCISDVDDCETADASLVGSRYSFNLAPPGVTSTYEPFAQECAAAHPPVAAASANLETARANLAAAQARKARLKAKLSNASGRRARRIRAKIRLVKSQIVELRGQVASSNAAYDSAAANEQAACSVPQ